MTIPLLTYLMPKDKLFFPLFEKSAANLEKGGKAIYQLVTCTDANEKNSLFREIEQIERTGDEITHEILNHLENKIITPFDREDIHRLATSMNDILDYIQGASKRIELYKPGKLPVEVTKLSEMILHSTVELRMTVCELKNMRQMRDITDSLSKIKNIENQADDVFDHAVGRLFENEKNAIEIIKVKEVLAALEDATDRVEDVAKVIRSIVVKMV